MSKTVLKYLALICAGVLVGSGINYAYAITSYKSGREIQLLNRATPLSDAPIAGEYLELYNVEKVRLTICTCTSAACTTRGGNLTGGNMQCWYQHPVLDWVINLDLTLPVGAPAQACRTWSDMWSPRGNGGGKMFCAGASVTAASGTHLDVSLEGIQ